MTQNRSELADLRRRIAALSREEQPLLAEGILADIRGAHLTDYEAIRQTYQAGFDSLRAQETARLRL